MIQIRKSEFKIFSFTRPDKKIRLVGEGGANYCSGKGHKFSLKTVQNMYV